MPMHLARKVEDRELPLLLGCKKHRGPASPARCRCGKKRCITHSSTFVEALINCMPVGHTFTILDQSVPGTIHDGMHKSTLPTVEAMLDEIQGRMRQYMYN